MKKSLIIVSLIMALGAFCQTSSRTTSKQTSVTSVSSNDVSSRSSITRSKGSYEFDAKFDKKKFDSVKELLLADLGNDNLQIKGKTYLWTQEKKGGEFFSCRLTGTTLDLFLDMEVASYDFADKINLLGDELRDLIQGHAPIVWTPQPPTPPNNPNSQDPQLAKDELRQAELALERARREVERLKKKQDN